MCYDISFNASLNLITDYLPGITIDPALLFDFEASPHVLAMAYKKYPVIIFEDGAYKLRNFEWGVIPEYMNTPEKIKKGRSFMCNARSEKIVGDRKSYWHRIRRERCLIPVTGTYEHREIKGWKNKVPYFIKIKGRNIFCIPGLYHYTHTPDDETGAPKGMFTLITREANGIMEQIQNSGSNAFRMSLYLPDKDMELKWLQPDATDRQISEILDCEIPSKKLECWPVYTIRSTKPRPDGKEKTAPYDWEGLPALESNALKK